MSRDRTLRLNLVSACRSQAPDRFGRFQSHQPVTEIGVFKNKNVYTANPGFGDFPNHIVHNIGSQHNKCPLLKNTICIFNRNFCKNSYLKKNKHGQASHQPAMDFSACEKPSAHATGWEPLEPSLALQDFVVKEADGWLRG